MDILPDELLLHVAKFLDPRDLANLRRTSRRLCSIASEASLYARFSLNLKRGANIPLHARGARWHQCVDDPSRIVEGVNHADIDVWKIGMLGAKIPDSVDTASIRFFIFPVANEIENAETGQIRNLVDLSALTKVSTLDLSRFVHCESQSPVVLFPPNLKKLYLEKNTSVYYLTSNDENLNDVDVHGLVQRCRRAHAVHNCVEKLYLSVEWTRVDIWDFDFSKFEKLRIVHIDYLFGNSPTIHPRIFKFPNSMRELHSPVFPTFFPRFVDENKIFLTLGKRSERSTWTELGATEFISVNEITDSRVHKFLHSGDVEDAQSRRLSVKFLGFETTRARCLHLRWAGESRCLSLQELYDDKIERPWNEWQLSEGFEAIFAHEMPAWNDYPWSSKSLRFLSMVITEPGRVKRMPNLVALHLDVLRLRKMKKSAFWTEIWKAVEDEIYDLPSLCALSIGMIQLDVRDSDEVERVVELIEASNILRRVKYFFFYSAGGAERACTRGDRKIFTSDSPISALVAFLNTDEGIKILPSRPFSYFINRDFKDWSYSM